jgi:hypothetical protein
VQAAVWIVDTPKNRVVAQSIWSADASRSHLVGVTTFKARDDSSPEDALIHELETIDLHHGVRVFRESTLHGCGSNRDRDQRQSQRKLC